MELLFENKTTVTKEIFNDFGKKTFKVYHKTYRFFAILGCIVGLLLSILFFIIDGLSISSVFTLVCSILFLFLFFKAYIIRSASSYKNFKLLNGESPQITFSFYQEKIEIISSISTLSLEYIKITKILETNKLIILMIGKQGLILYKSGFTVGNTDTFRSFIIEKCRKNIV